MSEAKSRVVQVCIKAGALAEGTKYSSCPPMVRMREPEANLCSTKLDSWYLMAQEKRVKLQARSV